MTRQSVINFFARLQLANDHGAGAIPDDEGPLCFSYSVFLSRQELLLGAACNCRAAQGLFPTEQEVNKKSRDTMVTKLLSQLLAIIVLSGPLQ